MAENNSRNLTANFVADTSGFSPKINELVQKLKSANQEFEQNKTKITALKSEMKNYQKELQSLEKEQKNGTTLTAEQKQRMQELRERIAACATQLGTYNSAQRQLTADMNSLNRQLSEARDEFNGTGQAASTFGEVLKANIASEAILGAINKIVDGLRQAAAYCYSTGSAFEAGMSKVAAVSGASADDLARLTEKAKDLGASTKFTATEVSEAMNYMAMAGWETEQMLSGIDGVLGLAAASGTDLATTSDIVTDALTAFGLKAKDCAHFADVLAAASSNANTNVSMMGETFKYCAPIAGALGFEAEDVAVGIGLMANAGVKASNAGTAMRKFMTELSEDLTITGEKIGEVTIQTSNADGTMRSFAEIMRDLRGVFAQLNDNEQMAAAKDIVGLNAATGFITMMKASEEDVQELTDAIKNCDGAAANMAETMEQNVQGAVTKMNSALEGVGISVYDKFKDSLLDSVNIFTEMLGDLKDDVDNGGLGESVEDLGASFKKLATEGAGIAQDVLPMLIKMLSGAMNIISTFGTEIGSIVKAFVMFKTVSGIGNIVMGVGKAFKTLAANIEFAGGKMNALKAAFAANPWGVIATGISLATFAVTEFISRSDSGAKGAEKLRERCEELTRQTAEYKQKCDDLAGIKEQYEEIANAVDPDIDKTEALITLQAQLKDQFPELAQNIDLVKDSYNGVVGALDDAIDKTSEYYRISAETAATALEKQERNKSTKITFIAKNFKNHVLIKDVKNAMGEMTAEELKGYGFGGGGSIGYNLIDESFEFKGTYEERLEQMKALREVILSINDGEYKDNNFTLALGEEIGKVQKLKEELESAHAEVDSFNKKDVKLDDNSSYGGAWLNDVYRKKQAQREAAEKAAEEQRKNDLEAAKKKYDAEKQLADDMYSVGELSAAEYYAKLTALRDQYLEAQTHDWYVATAKIKSYQDQNLKDQKSALSETERAYKKTLAAIDAEIERHNREKSDAEYAKKIADIEDRLEYGRLDEFEKYELEKERKRVEAEREEELFKRSTEDAKTAAKDEYDAQKAYLDAAQSTKDNTAALTEYTTAIKDVTTQSATNASETASDLKNVQNSLDNDCDSTRMYTNSIGNYTNMLSSVAAAMQSFVTGLSAARANGGVSNYDNSTKTQNVNVVMQGAAQSVNQLVKRVTKALSEKL